MAIHPILTYGDPRLVAENAPVERFDDALAVLVDDLFLTAAAAPGLGLAAPQVGVNLRLAVIDLSVAKDPQQRWVLANPEIVERHGSTTMEEGCLSFPGLFTTIDRPRSLRVRFQELDGAISESEVDGLLAQAVCHEVDHLDSVLIVDHLRGLKRRMFLKRVRKMRDTGAWAAAAG